MTRQHIALVTAAASWGGAATATKAALGRLDPLTLLFVQLMAATAILWLVLWRRGRGRGAPWRQAFLLGALEPGLAYLLITFGLQHTTAADETLLASLEAFFAALLAWLLLHERVHGRGWLAIGLGVSGAAMINWQGSTFAPGAGNALVLAGIFCAALYVVAASRFAAHADTLTMTTYQFTAALLLVLPLAAERLASGAETLPTHVSAFVWLIAGLSGVIGYGVSFLLYNFAAHEVAATSAAVIVSLIPVFGVLSALLALGERLTAAELLGAVLIIGSVWWFGAEEARIELAPALEEP